MIFDLSKIAGVEPAALHRFRRRLGILIVAEHDVAAAGKDLSVLVDLDLRVKERRTDRTVAIIHDSVDCKDRRAFRDAVSVQQIDAELAEHQHIAYRKRSSSADDIRQLSAERGLHHLRCHLSARALRHDAELLRERLDDHRDDEEAGRLRNLDILHDVPDISHDIAGPVVIEYHQVAYDQAEHMVHRKR